MVKCRHFFDRIKKYENMKKRHRIFVAINLPMEIKKELIGYQKKWPELPSKLTAPNNLHITLAFLGDLTDIELGEACLAIKEVSGRHSSFSINFKKISYGPEGKIPPRMIWAIGEKSKELLSLKKDLQNSLLEKSGLASDQKSLSPHITLARISAFKWRAIEIEERPEVNENIDLVFTVESIEVMESILKRTGPEYTIIESMQLR